MASVEVVEVPPVIPVKEYVLRLNEAEVDALVCLSGFIGGSIESPRRLLDQIINQLAKASGKSWMSTEAYGLVSEPKAANKIVFDDYNYNE